MAVHIGNKGIWRSVWSNRQRGVIRVQISDGKTKIIDLICVFPLYINALVVVKTEGAPTAFFILVALLRLSND